MRRWLALILLFTVLHLEASAVVVSRITDFESGTPAEADDVDAEFDNILDAINGNLSSENIVAQGIATSDVASRSITRPKMADLEEEISNSSEAAERSSATAGNVPNLSANITVDHRPVWVGLQAAGGDSSPGFVSYRNNGGGATSDSAYIAFNRNLSAVSKNAITSRDITNSTNDAYISLPCSAFWFLDDPGSGPHNYTATFRVATSDSGIIKVENCKLVVFEL